MRRVEFPATAQHQPPNRNVGTEVTVPFLDEGCPLVEDVSTILLYEDRVTGSRREAMGRCQVRAFQRNAERTSHGKYRS